MLPDISLLLVTPIKPYQQRATLPRGTAARTSFFEDEDGKEGGEEDREVREETAEEREERRKAMNREHARRSRDRKAEYVKTLEARINDMEEEILTLKADNARLRALQKVYGPRVEGAAAAAAGTGAAGAGGGGARGAAQRPVNAQVAEGPGVVAPLRPAVITAPRATGVVGVGVSGPAPALATTNANNAAGGAGARAAGAGGKGHSNNARAGEKPTARQGAGGPKAAETKGHGPASRGGAAAKK
jgi:hypothetical protein